MRSASSSTRASRSLVVQSRQRAMRHRNSASCRGSGCGFGSICSKIARAISCAASARRRWSRTATPSRAQPGAFKIAAATALASIVAPSRCESYLIALVERKANNGARGRMNTDKDNARCLA